MTTNMKWEIVTVNGIAMIKTTLIDGTYAIQPAGNQTLSEWLYDISVMNNQIAEYWAEGIDQFSPPVIIDPHEVLVPTMSLDV